jgi:polysaccharide export outer membrane protein
MRGLHAVILSLFAALAISGCMRTNAPVATAQSQSDLDSLAYGRSYGPGDAVMVGERWL